MAQDARGARRQHCLLDVRNDYEWEIGHFAGAELPALDTFREFPSFVRASKRERSPRDKGDDVLHGRDPLRAVSALLKKEGFEKVYQLDGGVINYGFKEGQSTGGESSLSSTTAWQCRSMKRRIESHQPMPSLRQKPRMSIITARIWTAMTLFLCCPSCADNFKGVAARRAEQRRACAPMRKRSGLSRFGGPIF